MAAGKQLTPDSFMNEQAEELTPDSFMAQQSPELPSLIDRLRAGVLGTAKTPQPVKTAAQRNEGMGRPPQEVLDAQPGFKQILTTAPPIITEGVLGGREGGALKGAGRVVEGMASPLNTAIMVGTAGLGALGPAINKYVGPALSGYFTADMAESLYQQAPAFREAWDSGDPARIGEAFTEAAATGVMGAAAMLHAKRGIQELRSKKALGVATPTLVPKAELTPDSFMNEQARVVEMPRREASAKTPDNISTKSRTGPETFRPAAEPEPFAPETTTPKPETKTVPRGTLEIVTSPEPKPEAKRAPKTPPAQGRETSIAIPGESTRYPARYAVRELDDVIASHNAQSFEPNPAYEHINDRDYSRTGAAARVAKQSSPGEFEPEFLTTDAPTAEHGAPIIDARGNVLGGNSRTMTIGRVYESGGKEAASYRNAVTGKAQTFGIADDLSRFKKPVLVREVGNVADAQRAITDFNKGAPAKLAPEEQAVADGRRLSSQTVQEIGARLGDLGESGTMAEALRGDDGAAVLNHLERDGVITSQEKGGLLDDRGALTPEAKGRIGKALVGRLFETPKEFRDTTLAMRQKLERIAPQALRVEGREDWSLTDRLREATALVEDARVHKMTVEEAAAQGIIGETRRYHPEALRLAEVLSENPKNAEYAFRRYANDESLSRDGSQGSFFEPPTRKQAFADAFGEDLPAESKPAAERPIASIEDKIKEVRAKAIADVQARVNAKLATKRNGGKIRTAADLKAAVSERRLQNQSGFLFGSGRKLKPSDVIRMNAEMDAAIADTVRQARERYEESGPKHAIDWLVPSIGVRVGREGGGMGRALMNMINRAGDIGEVEAGQKLVRLADAEVSKLTRDERFEVLDALEGRTGFPKEGRARKAFDAMRSITDELAHEATGLGVEVNTKNGRRPFAALEDYFPHVLKPAAQLKRGRLREDVIENIVRRGDKPNKKQAEAFLDDWISFLESGKRQESLLQHIVENGQAKNEAEALAKLQKKKLHIARSGSLEYSRELDLPFYDPDPVRVIPQVAATATKRLAQIAEFGQDHQKINEEILKITLAGGNSEFVRKSVDKMIGAVQEADTAEARAGQFLRAFSTLKLSLAQIPNATQSLNLIPATDFPALAYGFRAAMTQTGRRLAIESGASIDAVLNETTREMGGGRAIELYLKATGFTQVERFNRAVAANAGASWAKRNLEWAQGSGKKAERARGVLEALGVNTEAALRNGQLSERDVLMAAKKMSDLTQFRSRPQDLSAALGSSELGKVAFQFKSFSYQQAKFLKQQIYDEFRTGDKGRGLRNLLVFAAVFPAAGDAVRLIRNKITGKEEEFESGLDRYIAGVMQAGGIGIMMDAFKAVEEGHEIEFVAGPTAGQLKDFGRLGRALIDDDKDAEEKAAAVKKYVLTRFGSLTRRLWIDE